MSGEDIIHQRGMALENQFFAAVDEKLTAELRAKLTKATESAELTKACGIQDVTILECLVDAGVSPTTLPALSLFPLVAVAWADGLVEKSERESVLTAADKHSVDLDSPCGKILSSWLEKEPPATLFDAWEGFAGALVKKLGASEAETVKNRLLQEVKDVAQAAGGLLGWGSISKGESAVLNRIEKALTR